MVGWFGGFFPCCNNNKNGNNNSNSNNNNNNKKNVLHMLGAFCFGVSNLLPKRESHFTAEDRLNTRRVKRLSKAFHWQKWEGKVHSE